jgi:hypothetical protein
MWVQNIEKAWLFKALECLGVRPTCVILVGSLSRRFGPNLCLNRKTNY